MSPNTLVNKPFVLIISTSNCKSGFGFALVGQLYLKIGRTKISLAKKTRTDVGNGVQHVCHSRQRPVYRFGHRVKSPHVAHEGVLLTSTLFD